MAAELEEKVLRYKKMLESALDDVKKTTPNGTHMDRAADDYLNMARCYFNDGVHFIEADDPVNALVCFSYGHAWLDAGVRIGVFSVTNRELFAA
ncbi:MAG TPA: DUF357 domain-containing protein [Methanocella sp.]|nr:DUF357 domain-containing protein [Methanocella sp.]